jgi:hypothetical protein
MDNQTTPVLHYSRAYAAEQAAEQALDAQPPISRLNEAFTRGALGVCLAGWTVIGFFLWIPRMVRGIAAFSIALVQSTLTETSAEAAGASLRSAANFYRRGFVGAVDAIRPRAELLRDEAHPDAQARVDAGLIVREAAWAIVVWYVILWPTGILEGTPLDLASVPWSEYGSTIMLAVASVPELLRS